jgi:hypothetical protein
MRQAIEKGGGTLFKSGEMFWYHIAESSMVIGGGATGVGLLYLLDESSFLKGGGIGAFVVGALLTLLAKSAVEISVARMQRN